MRLLESARAVATSDPAVGGSAGVHLDKAFKAAGWDAMMQGKACRSRPARRSPSAWSRARPSSG